MAATVGIFLVGLLFFVPFKKEARTLFKALLTGAFIYALGWLTLVTLFFTAWALMFD